MEERDWGGEGLGEERSWGRRGTGEQFSGTRETGEERDWGGEGLGEERAGEHFPRRRGTGGPLNSPNLKSQKPLNL